MEGVDSRLPGYDYHQSGAHFVTLCTHRRELLFDDPLLRRVAEALWQRILRHCMACHFPTCNWTPGW
jgi:REP element-mobilizing transposase RayT